MESEVNRQALLSEVEVQFGSVARGQTPQGPAPVLLHRGGTHRLTVVDVFAGIGGLSCGFAGDSRFAVLAANEIDEFAAEAYRSNHPQTRVYRKDIKEFSIDEVRRDLGLESVDILIGGPACQAYSTSGLRNPDDPRGQLFREYARVLGEFRPSAFVFENVAGILSMHKGELFPAICDLFASLGYRVSHAVLDAADYGVPQRRKRVLVVGTKLSVPFVFPRPTHGDSEALRLRLTVADALSDLPLIRAGENSDQYAGEPRNEFQAGLRERTCRLTEHHAADHRDDLVALLELVPDGGKARDLPDAPEWLKEVKGFKNTYCRLWWDRPAMTVTRNFGTPSAARCVHPKVARGLTVREAARLQGFPDDYVFVGPRTVKAVQVANAVPPPLAAALASSIAEHFGLDAESHEGQRPLLVNEARPEGRSVSRAGDNGRKEVVPAAVPDAPRNDLAANPVGVEDQQAPPDPLIAISLFTGAGGLDLGLKQAGITVRLACETNPDARETISRNWPEVPLIGDIRDYNAAQIREATGIGDIDITLVAGGSPCQSFSPAGKRRGLDDPRGQLILTFVELATALHPRYVVIENVKGLVYFKDGAVLAKVLAMLKRAGYVVSFNTYDSTCFGAPQRRERLIIIASRDGRVPYLAPTHSDRPADSLPPCRTLRDAIGDMAAVDHNYLQFPDRRLEFFRKLRAGQDWRDLSDADQKAALSEATRRAEGGKTGFFRRLAWDKPSPTLVTRPNMPATDLCHPEELRPLSVEEYKRIQGFPDNFAVYGNIESQYRQLGNAVPVALGKAVGTAILKHLRTRESEDPMPDFQYSRDTRANDRAWCSLDTAAARLAEIAPMVRHIKRRTRRLLLITTRNILPRVRRAGRLLLEAKSLCRRCKTRWLPWLRENCGMSNRSAQVYMQVARDWKAIVESQSTAHFTSIDAVLKYLRRLKKKPEPTGDNDEGLDLTSVAAPGGCAEELAASQAAEVVPEDYAVDLPVTAGTTGSAGPASPDSPQEIAVEGVSLEGSLKALIRQRDQLAKQQLLILADLFSRFVPDVQAGDWGESDRNEFYGAADKMAQSLTSIRSALADRQEACRPLSAGASVALEGSKR